MERRIINIIKRLIHSVGYDLHRLNVDARPEYQLFQSLKKFEIDLMLDIGANQGQFASEIRSVGYKGQVVSFEPLSDAHKKSRKWRDEISFGQFIHVVR